MIGVIRRANPENRAAVSDVVQAAYSKYIERMGKRPAPMLEDYAARIRAGDVWVLARGEETLGVLVMRFTEDHLFVDNVAIGPEHQGKGLGRELMSFAEESARRGGLSEIRLYTHEKMWENLIFYRELGFEEIDRRLDGGYRRIFMTKRLPPEGVRRYSDAAY